MRLSQVMTSSKALTPLSLSCPTCNRDQSLPFPREMENDKNESMHPKAQPALKPFRCSSSVPPHIRSQMTQVTVRCRSCHL